MELIGRSDDGKNIYRVSCDRCSFYATIKARSESGVVDIVAREDWDFPQNKKGKCEHACPTCAEKLFSSHLTKLRR